MAVTVSLKELIESGAHFGHQARRWNPRMEEYIYAEKEGVHVFDLVKTKAKLEEALEYITQASKEGKQFLFLGTKKQAVEATESVAKKTNSFYVTERWLGGTITNFEQIRRSTQKLADMQSKMEKGEYKGYTKKERLLMEREIERLKRFFGGLVDYNDLPEVLIVVDTRRELSAVKEAAAKGITTVGLVDTNSDPLTVDYEIPMNDDASKAIEYVLGLIGEAILEGRTSSKSSSESAKSTKSVKEKK
jgi:small subunit ribosomal protein S2